MSKQPMGKTLLRNVIRHTDAHNKIQEEMEMWKMRDYEIHKSHNKHSSECVRGHMHCDRVSDQPRGLSRGREQVSEHDDREARYWTRKLYDFEANDPDRWGHSGFKELYPEELESDSEKNSPTKKSRHKKSKSDIEGSLSKRSIKSSGKKKKKKKKKEEEKKRKKAKCSSSDDSSASRDKQRKKKTKSRNKNKKTEKSRGKDEGSSSGDTDDEAQRERRTRRHKKRKQDSCRDSDSGSDSKKKRRKNWKAAGEESSGDSSTD